VVVRSAEVVRRGAAAVRLAVAVLVVEHHLGE